jgi:hypothetical protein
MASTPGGQISRLAFAAALVAVGAVSAHAAPAWVRNALSLGREDQLHATPPVARFYIQEGGAFILDRSHNPVLLKFDDSGEIWALSVSRGPRGDILFKDDVGDTLLRATKMGGMTVFTPQRPEGSAAALVGTAGALHDAPMGPTALYQRMILASVRCSHAVRHLVSFEAPDADPRSASLLGDAAALAVEAIVSVAGRPNGKTFAGRVTRVILAVGSRSGVSLQRGELVITVNPAQGLGGHPSSMRIEQAIAGS